MSVIAYNVSRKIIALKLINFPYTRQITLLFDFQFTSRYSTMLQPCCCFTTTHFFVLTTPEFIRKRSKF
ncbi:hypothetical protein E2986_10649 [Frieseomelitta varia]|uniref:Uncharacterized protein n=1 Tax=Frieseomelitta varia TaxID=561572 RepID=A0A833VXD3_9HYME|nr:hypothetical protein E2986_10649 [Frieseomelitta varia]